MTDRLIKLQEALAAAADARNMASTPLWPRIWEHLEQELLSKLLSVDATDDLSRYRLKVAIEVARQVRRTIETGGANVPMLEKELDLIENPQKRAIA